MYIVDENYRQFYFGTGVEYFFISQFYMMGVEAYKLNPDIGYDICVTNKGNARFKGDKSIDYFVQVKSAILVKNKTCFWIKKEDFEILMNDDKAVLICGMYKPIMRADPNSFY